MTTMKKEQRMKQRPTNSGGDCRIQTRHKKTSISKVTVTPISITHKYSNLEFLAFPATIYSNPVDKSLSGRLKVPEILVLIDKDLFVRGRVKGKN
jgi:hypothetical protein